jgi:hypothetical protein
MAVVIKFDGEKDHERAIDVLTDCGETYHGVAPASILVSAPAVHALRANGVRFQVVNEAARDKVDAAGARLQP